MTNIARVVLALICAAGLAIYNKEVRAGEGSVTCGVHSKYLGNLGVFYPKPVTQCSGSIGMSENFSLGLFFSIPHEGDWWSNPGYEFDVTGTYTWAHKSGVFVAFTGGVFVVPGDDMGFAHVYAGKTFSFSRGWSVTPFAAVEWNESLGNTVPSLGAFESGLEADIPLGHRWNLEPSVRFRFQSNDDHGVIPAVDLTFEIDDQTSFFVGAEARHSFVRDETEEVFRVGITRSFGW